MKAISSEPGVEINIKNAPPIPRLKDSGSVISHRAFLLAIASK
jgi:hypothetical protein